MIVGYPINARDYARVRTGTIAVEHAHAAQHSAFGDAVSRAADGAGDVCAVTVAVRAAAAKRVKDIRRTAAKLRVRSANARVDDVSAHARAGPVVGVSTTERQVALVNAIETPRRIGLGDVSLDDSIFLDELDSEVLAQSFGLFGRHLNRKTVKRVLVNVFEFAAVIAGHLVGDVRSDRERASFADDRIIEDYDVLVLNLVCVLAEFFFLLATHR